MSSRSIVGLGEDIGFPELFHAGLGYFPIIRWLERLTGNESRDDGATRHAALAYITWYKAGIVRAVPSGKDRLCAVEILVRPGSRLYPPQHPKIIPQLAYALATHPTSSRMAYSEALRVLRPLKFDVE